MLSRVTPSLYRNISTTTFNLSRRLPSVDDTKNPFKILKHDLVDGRLEKILPCPRETDVLIIGGSVVGSSAAYFIKEKQNQMNVVVIEPDSTYSKASALLSAGGMRQQFSCRENIEMSQFGFEFLRRAKQLLSVDREPPPDVQFNHGGYLILADKTQAEDMLKNHQLQRDLGAINKLLTPEMIKAKYPWINTEGLELASVGVQGEGWLDPAALLSSVKGKAKSLGANYVDGKVIGFERKTVSNPSGDRQILDMTLVQLPNGDIQPIKSPIIVNAAGPWAGQIAALAGIGDSSIDLTCSVPLPVEPRKRCIYYVHCPDGPGLDCGLVTDMSNGSVYWKREGLGNNYICGMSPAEDKEHDHSDLEVHYDFFDDEVWPRMANRVSAFQSLKLKSAWAGYYDYNYVDHNLIIGPHPYFNNFIFANGSSGHGLQHSPAIGRAISELINYQEYRTVNLTNLSFQRFLDTENLQLIGERNIY